jgi:caffeoyl-CoA O-methyltransferase
MSPLRSVPCAALLICALVTPTALAEEPPPSTLEDVLDRWVEAVGGRTAIEKLTTRTYDGEEIVDLAYRDPPRETASVHIEFRVPDRWKMVVEDEKGRYLTMCNGIVGWRTKPEGLEQDDSICRSLDALFLDPQAPLRIRDYYPDLALIGVRTLASGKKAYTVQATAPDKKQRDLYFDVDSGLLVQVGGNRTLEDFRKVDGVLVPHHVETSRKGGWAAYVFDSVIHGRPMDDAGFAPEPFAGIDDPRLLPMLEHLPYEHGGLNVPPRDGRLLHDLIVKRGYRRALEIGTSNGYSALWLGLALRETGGKLITIEYEPQRAEEARKNFERAGLGDVIDLRVADAFEEIPKIEGEFDFVLLDAWKPDYLAFWELTKDRVRPGGAYTAHNVIAHENHMRDFLEAIRSDPGFETTFHEVSDAGVSVSIRRE